MKLILFLMTALSFSAIGQTIITSSDFINAGDSVGISTSTDFSIDYTSTGTNSTWDFSNLTENNQLFEIAYDISSAGPIIGFQFGSFAPPIYQASFYKPFDGLPLDQIGGLLPVNIESINRLTKVENNKVSYVGYSLKANGQQVGFRSDTIETAYVLPLSFGDSYSSRGYTNMDFNPVFDAQFIQYRQRESTVDGEGQLITPYGTYDVVRVHHSISELDSIRVAIGGFNQWIPINRTINEYEWWDNGLKRPVLKIETEGAFGNETPTRITFLNNQIAELNQNTIEVAVFPNPTNEYITLQSIENIEKVNVISMDGKQVFSKEVASKQITIDLAHLSSGLYTIQTITKNGQSFNPIVIK
jgi:hypothetical protein